MTTEGLVGALGKVRALVDAFVRPYALIGGAAIVARVRVRTTRDCDLILQYDDRLPELLATARALGLVVPETREALAMFEAGLVPMRTGPGPMAFGVDVLACDSPYLERLVARASDVDLGGTTLRVASLEDLLLLKLDACRPIDFDDAIAIKDVAGTALDRALLAAEVDALGLRARVEQLVGPLGP